MPVFYCETDIYVFRTDAVEVVADDAHHAAELYGGGLFDTDDFDIAAPIEVIVAESPEGENAVRFKVRRTVTIDDDATEVGEVEIPADNEED